MGYAYLIWRSLDPVKVAAALAFGFVAAGSILSASAYLTGAVVGVATDLPWGVNYFGKAVHAVGLYQAVGLLILLIVLWVWPERERPGRVVLLAGLGYGLIRLITDGFLADPATISGFRVGQVAGLAVVVVCAWGLGRTCRKVKRHDLRRQKQRCVGQEHINATAQIHPCASVGYKWVNPACEINHGGFKQRSGKCSHMLLERDYQRNQTFTEI